MCMCKMTLKPHPPTMKFIYQVAPAGYDVPWARGLLCVLMLCVSVSHLQLAMGKVMEQGPVLIITFQAHMVLVVRDTKGLVVEGDPVCISLGNGYKKN